MSGPGLGAPCKRLARGELHCRWRKSVSRTIQPARRRKRGGRRVTVDCDQHMPDVIGIDHIYVTVSDMQVSERFYDAVMGALGFRKNEFVLGGDRHVQYYNRHFGYVLRPARSLRSHDPYASGLHHFCLRVASENDVREAAKKLEEAKI